LTPPRWLTRSTAHSRLRNTASPVLAKAEAKRQFKAAYELPLDIDVTSSEAKLENGVLTLKLGKQVPVSQAAQLQIN
jgi:HSP20 family molecular chaperone IbpA